jgi:hypothetical protein
MSALVKSELKSTLVKSELKSTLVKSESKSSLVKCGSKFDFFFKDKLGTPLLNQALTMMYLSAR